MDKEQARAIVKNTFENPFDKGKFTAFTKNLLNHVEEATFSHRGYVIPDAFEQNISSFERIGKYTDGENRIDIIVVRLKKETSIERARSLQRNFVAGYLNGKYGSSSVKEAALVAFVSPNNEDWRFSLVKMDYRFEEGKDGKVKVKEEFTPARRWSFLVGANENSHTAKSRLVPIIADVDHNPTLEELEEAFNIEKATKEFFGKYRDLFLWTKKELDNVVGKHSKIKADFDNKIVNTVDFAKKLLGQIVFLYFLQKKGWFGVQRDDNWGTGSKRFLRELFEGKHGKYGNFFNDILEPLFYEALRIDRSHDDDYYSRFNCKIPFLNGGLFDPINNYDWVHTDILLPNELFSNKKDDSDEGSGILDVFDLYNFTVKEDEPLEKEVAIDPELLGKVYEKFNAIRSDNYKEYKKALESGQKGAENKFNKQFGVYYTPREIVHYMCQQSLICYLHTELNQEVTSYEKIGDQQTDLIGDQVKKGQLDFSVKHTTGQEIKREDIETLIKYGEQVSENEATVIAKGRETDTYFHKIPKSVIENAKSIDDRLANIKVCDPAIGSGAFLVGMMSEIVKARNVLSTYLIPLDKGGTQGEFRTPYHFKRDCIENSLYGVDIDPGAVEIAKLRLWLSLVVDEEDIKQIKPLPNLDYKIVCGNSLLGVEKNIFNNELFVELERLKPLLFNETNPKKKQEYKNQIENLISQITNGRKEFDFEVYFSEVFHEKGGFDVVIANPPYVEHKKLKSVSHLFKGQYLTYSGTTDLYVYFYERGLDLLRSKGVLTFISSNKFTKTSYGAGLRGLLAQQKIQQIIDFTKIHIFEALVASCILIALKDKCNKELIFSSADDSIADFIDLSDFVSKNHIKIKSSGLNQDIWQLEDKKRLLLKSKIDANCKRIVDFEIINIFRGVTTGYNEAFVINNTIRNELIKSDHKCSEIIKPILQGRNIKKWIYEKSNASLLQTGYDLDIPKQYPYIFQYLSKFEKALIERDDQGRKWWNLRACTYYHEFEKEKIIWGLTANKWAFAYDNKGHYLPSNGYILTSREIPIKYLLALINSKLMEFYFHFIGIMTAGGAYTLKHETIGAFPIKEIPLSDQQPFVTLVDCILAITKDEDYLQNSEKQAKVKALEREIDQLVYKLYSLTEEEIRIVEGETKR